MFLSNHQLVGPDSLDLSLTLPGSNVGSFQIARIIKQYNQAIIATTSSLAEVFPEFLGTAAPTLPK